MKHQNPGDTPRQGHISKQRVRLPTEENLHSIFCETGFAVAELQTEFSFSHYRLSAYDDR